MSTEHPSPFLLDLLHLGALDEQGRRRVEQHLEDCAHCREEVARADADRQRFSRHLLAPALDRIAHQKRFRLPWLAAPTVVLAAILFFVLRAPTPTLTAKGGVAFFTYVRHAGQISAVHDGATLHPGDELRFAAVSPSLPYLLVVSIDGAGAASVYFPFDGAESGSIERGRRVELPGSITLDDAPGPERVFALFSARPLSASEVTSVLRDHDASKPTAIRQTLQLPVSADEQLTVLFEKAP